jgi:hypothetical protein
LAEVHLPEIVISDFDHAVSVAVGATARKN